MLARNLLILFALACTLAQVAKAAEAAEPSGSGSKPTGNDSRCSHYLCSQQIRPVCGTDGRTYRNLCLLERLSCLRHSNLSVRHRGPCHYDTHMHPNNFKPKPPG